MKDSKSVLIKGNGRGVFVGMGVGAGGDGHGGKEAQTHLAKMENPKEMKVGKMNKGP